MVHRQHVFLYSASESFHPHMLRVATHEMASKKKRILADSISSRKWNVSMWRRPNYYHKSSIHSAHLCKNDWNTKNISSKNTWSTWTRKSYGVQRYPAWVWVGPALGLRAKKFKIWSHGTKIFGSKISLHKVIQVPWRYFVGFWNQNSFGGLTG